MLLVSCWWFVSRFFVVDEFVFVFEVVCIYIILFHDNIQRMWEIELNLVVIELYGNMLKQCS